MVLATLAITTWTLVHALVSVCTTTHTNPAVDKIIVVMLAVLFEGLSSH